MNAGRFEEADQFLKMVSFDTLSHLPPGGPVWMYSSGYIKNNIKIRRRKRQISECLTIIIENYKKWKF